MAGLRDVAPGFDPFGAGFDTDNSRASGARPATSGPNKGHLPSRDPRTGQILKGRAHESFDKAIEEDLGLGFRPFIERGSGRIFTFRDSPDPKRFEAADPRALINENRRQVRERRNRAP